MFPICLTQKVFHTNVYLLQLNIVRFVVSSDWSLSNMRFVSRSKIVKKTSHKRIFWSLSIMFKCVNAIQYRYDWFVLALWPTIVEFHAWKRVGKLSSYSVMGSCRSSPDTLANALFFYFYPILYQKLNNTIWLVIHVYYLGNIPAMLWDYVLHLGYFALSFSYAMWNKGVNIVC